MSGVKVAPLAVAWEDSRLAPESDNIRVSCGNAGKFHGDIPTGKEFKEDDRNGRKNVDMETWSDFAEGTTLHGLKYVFNGSTRKGFRRYFWLSCVVGALLVFVVQVGLRTGDYFEFQTTVNVQVIYSSQVKFPAVTVCNQNSFRLSKVVDKDKYWLLDMAFGTEEVADIDFVGYNLSEVDTRSFILDTAHQLDDLLHKCSWAKQPCSTADFVRTVTDFGVCYTFNADPIGSTRHSSSPGSTSGLTLLLNVEQYEYMAGPHSDAGIKVLLHDQGQTPMIQDLGFAVAPGTHTLVAVKQYQINSLAAPYGLCDMEGEPLANCLTRCKARLMVQQCGCVQNYLQDQNVTEANVPVCDLQQWVVCTRNVTDNFRPVDSCQCTYSCARTVYEASLSYTLLSKRNALKMARQKNILDQGLQRRFRQANEDAQRVFAEIAVVDGERFQRMRNSLIGIRRYLDRSTKPLIIDAVSRSIAEDNARFTESAQFTRLRFSPFEQRFLSIISSLQGLALRFLGLTDFFTPPIPGMFITERASKMYTWLSFCLNQSGIDLDFQDLITLPHEDTCILFDEPEGLYYQREDSVNCSLYVSSKVKCADKYLYLLETATSEMESALGDYEQLLAELFEDTPGNITIIKSLLSKDCLGRLAKGPGLAQQVRTVRQYLEKFTASENLEELVQAARNITLEVQGNVMWKGGEIDDWRMGCIFDPFRLYVAPEVNRASTMTAEHKSKLAAAYGSLVNKMSELEEKMEKVSEIEELIQRYESSILTKRELALLVRSEQTDAILPNLMEHHKHFNSLTLDLADALQTYLRDSLEQYASWLTLRIPVIKTSQIGNLSVVGYALSLSEDSVVVPTKCCMPNDISDIITAIFENQLHSLVVNANLLSRRFSAMNEAYDAIRLELVEYERSTRLDSQFVLENFLQIDVFYSELSYEKIDQQAAFESLSLLGEIGGFLGLLLGASVLTMVELLDFLVSLFFNRCTISTKP